MSTPVTYGRIVHVRIGDDKRVALEALARSRGQTMSDVLRLAAARELAIGEMDRRAAEKKANGRRAPA